MKIFNGSQKGLTMIEILIAVIVLMIGLVGILALFPVGIASTKETEEDSYAAMVADSVCQALQAAMRMPSIDPIGVPVVKMSHDGLPLDPDSNECIYTFGLPVFVTDLTRYGSKPRLFAHPQNKDPQATTTYYSSDYTKSEPEYVFRLGNNPAIRETYEEVISGPDSTDPYTQYGFAFTVMRVDDLDLAGASPPPNRRARPLFEFKIYVYRLPVTEEIKVYELKPGQKPKQVFTVQISGL